jgi:hypothetical protein
LIFHNQKIQFESGRPRIQDCNETFLLFKLDPSFGLIAQKSLSKFKQNKKFQNNKINHRQKERTNNFTYSLISIVKLGLADNQT